MTDTYSTTDRPRTILFIVLPYPSHFNSIFGLAEEFRRLGWRTVATVSKMTRAHAENLGFETIPWKYLDEIRISNVRQFLAFFIKSHAKIGFKFGRLRQFISHSQSAREVVSDLGPSMILVDRHLGYYSIILGKKVIIFDTKVSSLRQPGIAPFSSGRRPSKFKILEDVVSWIHWETHNILLFIRRLASAIALGSTYELKYLQRECRINGLDWYGAFRLGNYMYDDWTHVQRLLLYPRCFEYGWYKVNKNDTHLWFPGRPGISSPLVEYEAIAKPADKLIYFSVGTISSNVSFVVDLITVLKSIVKSQPNWYMILSVGNLFDEVNDKDCNSHGIWFHRHVDQPYILSLCDLFISHGGFNSVKESVMSLVPMLIYPTNLTSDQPGNGARVDYHGIGLTGRITKINRQSLKKKLDYLLNNPRFIRNLRKLKREFEGEATQSRIQFANICSTLTNLNYEKDL